MNSGAVKVDQRSSVEAAAAKFESEEEKAEELEEKGDVRS